ncbi:MAG: hypothetical protein JWN45_2930 [Acidobacteriaceae bacterium]|nr:hypothetical protein [Acidobacteriaceae bacterium]
MRSRLALIILTVAVLLHSASAGIRPSFALDYSSWHATDVVVVMATDKGGSFVVVESLKGNLLPGEVIQIPELQPDKNARPIADYPQGLLFGKNDIRNGRVPKQTAGSQLILFLKSMLVNATTADTRQQLTGPAWESADPMQHMKASVVWLYGEKLYAFRQLVNPGASLLRLLEMQEAKLRATVSEIVTTQQQLIQISQIADPRQRSEALKPYVLLKIFPASRFALDELGSAERPPCLRFVECWMTPLSLHSEQS